ncbi:MAG TPA: type II secretion system F family protein [Mycobacteriales bacterium]|nr:type II secretion system F family protein [Mycobacteriales bacterium]
MTGLGLLLGAAAGLGLLVMAAYNPVARRPRLDDRLAPYLRDTPRPSRLLAQAGTRTPFPTLERLLAPVLADLVRFVDRAVGGAGSVRRRLDQAGRAMTVEQFRTEQVIWGAAGLLVGVLVSTVLLLRGGANPLPLLVLCLLLALAGVLARDRWLSRDVRVREQRIVAEFPTVAELLALAVTAGETPVAALDRVTRLSSGELSREVARALADARAGASLVSALDGVARRTSLPLLARFVDGMAVAVERGTPLAEVLRAQAADVREAGRRALLDSGGKREIAMLAPIVFLILPVVIVFLVFPGFYGLDIAAP